MDVETRVGTYSGGVEELVSHYSKDFIDFPFHDPRVVKRVLVIEDGSDNYLMIISKNHRDKHVYNIMVTIMGSKTEKIKELMSDLEKKLPIKLEPAPKSTEKFHKQMIKVASMYASAKNN